MRHVADALEARVTLIRHVGVGERAAGGWVGPLGELCRGWVGWLLVPLARLAHARRDEAGVPGWVFGQVSGEVLWDDGEPGGRGGRHDATASVRRRRERRVMGQHLRMRLFPQHRPGTALERAVFVVRLIPAWPASAMGEVVVH